MPQITTNEGPSGKNQTSDDHSRDADQPRNRTSIEEELAADGLNIPSDTSTNQ